MIYYMKKEEEKKPCYQREPIHSYGLRTNTDEHLHLRLLQLQRTSASSRTIHAVQHHRTQTPASHSRHVGCGKCTGLSEGKGGGVKLSLVLAAMEDRVKAIVITLYRVSVPRRTQLPAEL